jgi:hypothetical protein
LYFVQFIAVTKLSGVFVRFSCALAVHAQQRVAATWPPGAQTPCGVRDELRVAAFGGSQPSQKKKNWWRCHVTRAIASSIHCELTPAPLCSFCV